MCKSSARTWIFVFFLALGFFPSFGANSEEGADTELFREIAGELRCPSCNGLSILESDADFSLQIRKEVEKQIAKGKSREEILGFFEDRYGTWILRSPSSKGLQMFLWWIPFFILAAGPAVLYAYYRGLIKPQNAAPAMSDEEILSRMMIEIENMKNGGSA
ncbi:MAG: cytochrome c-type biogenesis protein CcmH [Oligoflexales bacterium]|nr:cytochrome c-type biogenesis protein CcmH [Oligoflexales bacterium]